jgi:hypothetical protein
MLLIDNTDTVHINEAARAVLKQCWRDAYTKNVQLLIPDMASELDAGYVYAAGVKLIDSV